jgi:hypothetical protein
MITNRSCSNNDDTLASTIVRIESLQARYQALLADLEQFHDHLKSRNLEKTVDLRTIQSNIRADLRALEKLDPQQERERTVHLLRSSNLAFYEAVWDVAKRSKGVIAFSHRFYWDEKCAPKQSINGQQKAHATPDKSNASIRRHKAGAIVDIVADDGAEWIKVSTVTERRLLWDLARQGWNPADDSSDSEDAASRQNSDSGSDSEVGIVRMAQALYTASRHIRVRYKHPRVHLVLKNLGDKVTQPVSTLIDRITRIGSGITITLAPDLSVPAPELSTAMQTSMISNALASLTTTLNIDCTVLLALVSDLSHVKVIKQEDWFHRATIRQLEVEAGEALLPNTLYPAMEGRDLVCTVESASRMREIVGIIATDNERRRTDLLLFDGDDAAYDRDSQSVLYEWAQLSEHSLPHRLKLPIRLVSTDDATAYPTTVDTSVAEKVAPQLSALNQSIFLYAWRAGIATLTSNRTVAKQIDGIIDEALDAMTPHRSAKKGEGGSIGNDFIGPKLWLCATSRSLIGKDKGRKK